MLESADVVQEQRLSEEGDVVGIEETPLRRDVSNQNRTGQVRLWVLEISTSGLIDTPRVHAVSSGDKLFVSLIWLFVVDFPSKNSRSSYRQCFGPYHVVLKRTPMAKGVPRPGAESIYK